jgi:nicotinamide mononucleotide transporter
MLEFFSVNKVFFTVLDYPMSYIEFIGTICYLWSVWLIARRKMLTWPVGIVSVILYMILFYQIRLYSDTIEQIYYLGASVYGWWHWSKTRQETPDQTIVVSYSSKEWIIGWIAITLAISLLTGAFFTRVHLLLPTIFPEEASFPYLDAITTIMSFTAMWLMARKKIESWIYWIIVDIIGIGLYYVKEVKFVALLYVILLGMATNGFISWNKAAKKSKDLSLTN